MSIDGNNNNGHGFSLTEHFQTPLTLWRTFPGASNVGNLPPDATEEVKRADMRRRAEAFFNKRDGQGNQILWFLVESLFSEYWERALPDLFRPPDKNIDPAIVLSSKPLG
jgi:hypothetical protein